MVERKKEAIEMMKDSDALASQQLVEDSMVSFEMLKGN